ncbi:MAG: exonuclease SbcCD subunit D [Clostridia bacterium]|nr:exonuclease SbcCD subunit D [Clostridia bacterium]
MKFLHLGDLHLGKRVYGYSMIEDQRVVLEQIVQMAREQQVDAVLIAGDIYDKTVPSGEAVSLFDSFFTALCAEKITVLAISGNHDSGERLDFGRTLLAQQGMHLAGTFDSEVEAVTLCDADGCQVQFHLLPWLRPMELKEKLKLEKSNQQCAVQAVLERAQWDEHARHVLLAHTFVTVGGELPAQSESEIIPIGGVDAVDVALFDRYDYAALGHIHRPQRLGRDSVRYSGSPLKYSFSEARYAKSVPLVTIHTAGEPEIELLPLKPRHDLREIRGRLEDVTSELAVQAGEAEDYIRIILTDEEELYDPQGALKAVYPNLMRLDFDNTRTRAADSEGLQKEDAVRQLTAAQLFAQFFAEQNGKEMTQWQEDRIADICRRMEDDNEAD